jgi:hypothetical protein
MGMIQDYIQQLRSRLTTASGLPEQTRQELLGLVSALEDETAARGEGQPAIGEASVGTDSPALQRLVGSVEELEASHPELVASLNRVASVLGKMGI